MFVLTSTIHSIMDNFSLRCCAGFLAFRCSVSLVLTSSQQTEHSGEGDSSTTFVIDVKNEFGMGGNSRVTLSGGLTWDNVLFNLGGEGDAFLAKNAQLDGIILARKRSVEVKGSAQVRGEIIAGRVVLTGASVVGRIPVVSP